MKAVCRKLAATGLCFFIVAATLPFLAGCGEGLPKDVKQHAKALPDLIKKEQDRVARQQQKFEKTAADPEFEPYRPYAQKELWNGKFVAAKEALKRASNLYDSDLSPLVSQNRAEGAEAVNQQIKRIKGIIAEAGVLAAYPMARVGAINKAMSQPEIIVEQARIDADSIVRAVDTFQNQTLDKALSAFPDASSEINKKAAPFLALGQKASEDLAGIQAQYDAHEKGLDVDYAALADHGATLADSRNKADRFSTEMNDAFESLYKSYTKILRDMKVTYQVTIKRESWDENSDFYNPQFATFTREVPEDIYLVVAADNLENIAEVKPGFRGSQFITHIKADMWKYLEIDPGARWPTRAHNAAVFYLEDSTEKYFHKYLLEEGGETSETDWQPVSESFYESNIEYLGMAILSKPYGVFEQDRLTQAAPPGMAYVGNPKYGEWKEENNGNRFWSWYGRYAFFSSLFFFPPSYYSYGSWNGWYNNYRYRRPYFGQSENGSARYGTYGTYVKKSPKYQSSDYARSGGFKSRSASVRGSGPGLRGGGPGNRGK